MTWLNTSIQLPTVWSWVWFHHTVGSFNLIHITQVRWYQWPPHSLQDHLRWFQQHIDLCENLNQSSYYPTFFITQMWNLLMLWLWMVKWSVSAISTGLSLATKWSIFLTTSMGPLTTYSTQSTSVSPSWLGEAAESRVSKSKTW